MVQARIKPALRRTLGWTAPLVMRFRPRPSLLILTYHRVLPAGHAAQPVEQPGMYVSPDTLAMHLRVLKRHFDIVDLGDWLRWQRDGSALPDRACCITFDDGWRDNFAYGFPVLRAARVPATIFLVADFIGTRYRFWPNRLATLLGALDGADQRRLPGELLAVLEQAKFVRGEAGTPVSQVQLDRVIGACKKLPDAVVVGLLDAVEAAGGPAAGEGERDLLDLPEILAMRDSGLVNFGSHSRQHTRLLAHLDSGTLDDEVRMSRRILERDIGRPVEIFCFPNGDYSPAALAAVREVYAAAVTTAPGWNATPGDLHLLRRMSVHEDISADPASFLARAAGLA